MIVGLLGFIGSGKGTVADILVDHFGYTKMSFADSLKDCCALMFNWPRHLLEGDTKESREWRETPDEFWSKEFGKQFTPRIALQLMGTESVREVFHEDFWIIRLQNTLKSTGLTDVVIADTRFENEVNWVQRRGGLILEVQRGETPHWYELAKHANAGSVDALAGMKRLGVHDSEWRWVGTNRDHLILNDGTLEDLTQNVREIMRHYVG